MSDTPKCTGTNRDGTPCSARPQPDRPFCLWHDPERAADRKRWTQNAGRAKAHRVQARKKILAAGLELPAVDAALCKALQDVLAGEIEPNVATAAATLARAIVATRQAGELEQRIAALEERAGLTERSA